MNLISLDLVLSPEVEAAKQNGTPIVALESTIITHGMPYPQNLEVAKQVEADIRAKLDEKAIEARRQLMSES